MNMIQIALFSAFIALAAGCTTTTQQQTRSASGVSLELLDSCSRVTTDYLNSLNISATHTPENQPETPSKTGKDTSETEPNLLDSLPDDVDPMIPMCMSLIDREIEAQTYILANRSTVSDYYDYGYWHPRSHRAYGSYRYGFGYHTSPFFGRYGIYNRGFGHRRYTNHGHYNRHGNANPRTSRSNTGTRGTPAPSPAQSQPPATPAPAPRPRPAKRPAQVERTPPPQRNRTEQSNRRERR
jgi:hypothetical protein